MSSRNAKFGRFKLDLAPQYNATAAQPSSASNNGCFTSEIDTSQPPHIYHGSYSSDLAAGEYPLSWPSMDAMGLWLRKEERVQFIELRLKEVVQHPHNHWDEKLVYVCARQGTGGVKGYEKKIQHRQKVPTKRMSCPCRLVVKSYPNMDLVLGRYNGSHSHPVGKDNAKFTRLSQDARILIAEKLRAGISHARIVRNLFIYLY
jgi:hypothetical protein